MKIRIGTLRSSFICLVAAFIGTSLGCSQEERLELSDARLSGRIEYKGKPVPYALVIVQGEKASVTGNADEEGNYIVEHAPTGQVQIGVNTEAGKGRMMGAQMAAAQSGDSSKKVSFVDVPKKYFDPSSSGLTATVAESKDTQEHDIIIE
jgi:hypothetical protein